MACLIGLLTLTPSAGAGSSGPALCLFCGERALADALLNIVMFMPLGAALFSASGSLRWSMLAMAIFSAVIELAQLGWIPGRDSNPRDLVSNFLGGFLGAALVRTAHWWMVPAPRRRAGIAASAMVLGLAVLATGGALLSPHLPHTTWFGQWTPRLDHLEWYGGDVLSAQVGSFHVPSGRLNDAPAVRALLAEEQPLQVTFVAGPPAAALAPIFSIADDQPSTIRMLGTDRDDGVFRYRTLSSALRLDEPSLRVPGAFADVRAGDTTLYRVRHLGHGFCVQIGAREECGIGYRLSDTWEVLLSPGSWPAWLRTATGLGWLAGLFAPAGFLLLTRREVSLAGIVIVSGFLLIPYVTNLLPATVPELIAGPAGLALAYRLRRYRRLRPSD